jgi:hypothetical protein
VDSRPSKVEQRMKVTARLKPGTSVVVFSATLFGRDRARGILEWEATHTAPDRVLNRPPALSGPSGLSFTPDAETNVVSHSPEPNRLPEIIAMPTMVTTPTTASTIHLTVTFQRSYISNCSSLRKVIIGVSRLLLWLGGSMAKSQSNAVKCLVRRRYSKASPYQFSSCSWVP